MGKKWKPFITVILILPLIAVLCRIMWFSGLIVYTGWAYSLPNTYEVLQTMSIGVVIQCDYQWSYVPSFEGGALPDGYFEYRIAVKDNYIFVEAEDLMSPENHVWVIADENSEQLFGPYQTQESFANQLEALGIDSMVLWKTAEPGLRIAANVDEFCYNQRYIGVIQSPKSSADARQWFLIDSAEDIIFGPYKSAEEYELALLENNASEMCDWIVTEKKPKDALPNLRDAIKNVFSKEFWT